jgi:hypothetical protein
VRLSPAAASLCNCPVFNFAAIHKYSVDRVRVGLGWFGCCLFFQTLFTSMKREEKETQR